MTKQGVLFKGQKIEVVDDSLRAKRAEYAKFKGQPPSFGMGKRGQIKVAREAIMAKRVARQENINEDGQLKGLTTARAVKAEDVRDGLVVLSRAGVQAWQGCYFAIAIIETHESFWWNTKALIDMYDGWDDNEGASDEPGPWDDSIIVPLATALEYHKPLNPPFGWPWGKSPMDKVGPDFKGRIYVSDIVPVHLSPGWTAYGNQHPSGGESEGYYVN